jgi:Flp pilus assembly protein TadD
MAADDLTKIPLRQRLLPVWQGGLIVLLVVLAYLPALRNGFIWDDDAYVTQNPLLTAPDGLRRIWFSLYTQSQYFPLVYTTLRFEYGLWGLHPLGYHIVNVLLHSANALLVWLVLKRLALPGTWLAAAIFALHPVQVETVAWITELKNTESTFFYLLALLAWMKFAGTNSQRFYTLTFLLYALALFGKTTACTLPAVMLLVLWWKREPISRQRWLQVVPFLAAGLAMGLLSIWWEKHLGNYQPRYGLEFSPVERLLIATRAVWFYAGKLLWPVNLAFSYPRWNLNPSDPWQYLWAMGCALVAVCLWLGRHALGRGPVAAIVFFVVVLSPMLGFIPLFTFYYTFVADHYQYLACVGPIALSAAVLTHFSQKWRINLSARYAGALVFLLTLAVLTWRQACVYQDLGTLWRDTVAKNPDSWLAHNNLGIYLYREGHRKEAIDHYHKAIKINPDRSDAYYELGAVLGDEGRWDEAIENYRKAIQLNPDYAFALNNLGNALVARGQLDEAIQSYRRAVQLAPTYSTALNNLGVALAANGEFDEAIQSYRRAIQSNPRNSEPRVNLGLTLGELGRTREAAEQYRAALQLNPNLTTALNNLAWALATSPDDQFRNGTEAVRLAGHACELTHYTQPWFLGTLGAAYAETGRFPEAVAMAEKAGQIATATGQAPLVMKERQLLEVYRAGKPYREPPPSGQK